MVRNSKGKRKHFNTYTYKVLKQVHPEIGISKQAMEVMDSFIWDLFHRIGKEAEQLMIRSSRCTLGAREIATASSLVLRGELGMHNILYNTLTYVSFFMCSLFVATHSQSEGFKSVILAIYLRSSQFRLH